MHVSGGQQGFKQLKGASVHRAIRHLLPLLLAAIAAPGFAAEDCGFISSAELDAAFGEFAPWHTMVGGAVGHCSFASDESRPPNLLSFMQQFKPSKAAADQIFNAMREGLDGDHAVTTLSGLGDRAFHYASKNELANNPHTVSIVMQKDKLVVTTMIVLQRPVNETDLANAAQLSRLALRGAGDPAMAHKASSCPWFEEKSLGRLFGGHPHEVQVYGEDSCMAVDKQSRSLLLSVTPLTNGLTLAALRDAGCQTRDLPNLGDDATLSFACAGGNPRAQVSFAANDTAISFTWIPNGSTPSDAETAALIDLASAARRARRSQ